MSLITGVVSLPAQAVSGESAVGFVAVAINADGQLVLVDSAGATKTAVAAATSTTATHALFATAVAGVYGLRAIDGSDIAAGNIAAARIAAALATPGPIGGTTPAAGSFTTVSLPTTTSSVGIVKVNSSNFLHAYGTNNAFLGFSTGNFTTTGAQNVGIGYQALGALTSGSENVGLGYAAGGGLTSGNYNLCLGSQAGAALTNTSSNIAIGYVAAGGRITGGNSITIGSNAQLNVTTGGNNAMVVIGDYAGPSASGNYCTIIGSYAGRGLSSGAAALTTGASNTLIGNQADVSSATGTYRTVIGAEAVGTANNSVTLGRSADAVMIPGTLAATGASTLTGDVTLGGLLISGTPQSLTGSGALAAINLTKLTTVLRPSGTATTTLTDGTVDGQMKIIHTQGAYATVVTGNIDGQGPSGTISFADTTGAALLQWDATAGTWAVLGIYGGVAIP